LMCRLAQIGDAKRQRRNEDSEMGTQKRQRRKGTRNLETPISIK